MQTEYTALANGFVGMPKSEFERDLYLSVLAQRIEQSLLTARAIQGAERITDTDRQMAAAVAERAVMSMDPARLETARTRAKHRAEEAARDVRVEIDRTFVDTRDEHVAARITKSFAAMLARDLADRILAAFHVGLVPSIATRQCQECPRTLQNAQDRNRGLCAACWLERQPAASDAREAVSR